MSSQTAKEYARTYVDSESVVSFEKIQSFTSAIQAALREVDYSEAMV